LLCTHICVLQLLGESQQNYQSRLTSRNRLVLGTSGTCLGKKKLYAYRMHPQVLVSASLVQLVSASSPSHQFLGSKPSLCRISAGVRLCFGYSLPQTPLVWEPLALGLPFTVCIRAYMCQSAATWTKQRHLRYALIGWQLEAILILRLARLSRAPLHDLVL
jgi:hypothetical protein